MKYICIVVAFLCSFAGKSQTQDKLLLERYQFNLQKQKIEYSLPLHSTGYLSPKKMVLPVGMLVYGFISLNNEDLQEANKEVQEEILEHNSTFHTKIDNYLQFAPAASVYILNASGIKGQHNFRDRTIILGISTALMAGTVFALKKITHQQRPDGSAYNSFPSGHTATAFSGAEFMQLEYKGHSPLLRYSGYAMAAGTGVLRMYNNRHWLGDVIAGAGVGILSTRASYWLWEKMKKKNIKSSPIL
jgi:hypothetical protein